MRYAELDGETGDVRYDPFTYDPNVKPKKKKIIF